jgi:predicted ABC-type ATPase
VSEYLNEKTLKSARPLIGEAPTYTMLGGRGGSGKGSFTKSVNDGGLDIIDKKRVVFLDADEIKGKLDGYEGWNAFLYHEESSYLFDHITNMARDLGLNVTHDMTLKTGATAITRAKTFIKAGYEVDGHYMFLPPQEATRRAISRFYTKKEDFSGRFVPPDVVLGNTKNEANFDRLKEYFTRWTFYDNQGPRGSKPLLVGSGGL